MYSTLADTRGYCWQKPESWNMFQGSSLALPPELQMWWGKSHLLREHTRRRPAVTWTWRAALSRMNGGVATGRHRAGDQSAHFPSTVTVAFPAPVMPAFLIFMMMTLHGQTCAWQDRWPGCSRDLWTDRRQPGKEGATAQEKQPVVPYR